MSRVFQLFALLCVAACICACTSTKPNQEEVGVVPTPQLWFGSNAKAAPLDLMFVGQTVEEVSRDGEVVGWMFTSDQFPPNRKGKHGPVVLLVGLGTDARIKGIHVLSHKEDARFFARLKESFFKQFDGKRADTDIADFDAVTRATYSSTAVIHEVVLSARRLASIPEIAKKIEATGTKPVDPPPLSAP